MNNRILPLLLRVCAAAITIVAIVVFFVELRDLRAGGILASLQQLIATPVIMIAMALALAGLADLLAHASDTSPEISRNFNRLNSALADVQKRVDDVAVTADRIARNRSAATAAPPPAPPTHITASLAHGALDPLVKAIEEVREISLLTDAERKQRLANMEHERKRMLVRQVIEHMERSRWSAGAAMLATLDREHPDDPEAKRIRSQFEEARRNAESSTVARSRDQTENYIGIGAWDQAFGVARQLVDDFPGNVEASRLLARVQRERDIHVETSVSRMVEEIRHDIDRRLWRRAYQHAQRLIDRYPDHQKTARIKEQVVTLQQNAEIEERQELEVRIQELIRGHKFQDAIDLSEELLNRFPHSPQAEAIEKLLPRIRELASEHNAPAA